MEKSQQLLSRVAISTKHHKDLAYISGSDFNIFRTINVTSDEVKHSAFLAELLNPKGTHGQKDIFLKLFVQKFNVENFNCETAYVKVEKSIGSVTEKDGGRIDIFIDDQKGNHIIIENKIYANDQYNQLIRYFNFSSKNVFYLTLDGRESTAKSSKDELNGINLENGKHYQSISYKTDIIQWLESCQKEAALLPLLREGISHYINLIKYLVGESTNKAMNKEIINLISENPSNLSSAREIYNNYLSAKANIQWSFWKALIASVNEKGIIIDNNEKTVTSARTWNYYYKKDMYFGIWSEIYKKDGITIHWGCQIEDSIYSGFTLEKDGIGGISSNEENSIYRKIIESCDPNYQPSEWWLGWQYSTPKLDFRSFNSDEVLSLSNESELNKIVKDIVEKAFVDIQNVQLKLEKL